MREFEKNEFVRFITLRRSFKLEPRMFELRELQRRVQISQLSQDDEGECAQDRAL
jgi:hypothetical protein